MYDAGHVIRKCSYACSYLLFISLIIFFSLPTITVAFNVSHSTPTQCSPFQVVIWDNPDSALHIYNGLYLLPLDDRPVSLYNLSIGHDMDNFTLNKLPLKAGTEFVIALNYQACALFSNSQIQSAHTIPIPT